MWIKRKNLGHTEAFVIFALVEEMLTIFVTGAIYPCGEPIFCHVEKVEEILLKQRVIASFY